MLPKIMKKNYYIEEKEVKSDYNSQVYSYLNSLTFFLVFFYNYI